MSKPVVDGIERDLGNRGHVVRLNVHDAAGQEAAGRYGLTAVPTLLVFLDGGEPTARFVGRPDHGQVMRALTGS